MEKTHPWIINKISTVYNGVDLKKFVPAKSNDGNHSEIKFLVLGSIRKLKNFEGLIRSLKIYREKYGNNIKINWAGKVSHTRIDLDAYNNAENYIDKHNINGLFNWIGEQEDIPTLINSHDAIIMPSFHEGLPNAICEGLACGKPVLASNVCEHPRLVQEDITGYLFDPYDPGSIAECMYKFANLSLGKRSEMGRNARRFAETELSVSRYVDEYDKIIKQLIYKYSA